MWDHIDPAALRAAAAEPGGLSTGTRVARVGRVSFTRAGFVRVRWDDGTTSDEWAPDLVIVDE